MKIAVVGATGMVGTIMMKLLEERNFPVSELIPVASERSVGKIVTFKGKDYKIVGLDKAVSLKPEIAIFSAGGDTSLAWAPKFAEAGCVVIDNSSAWRMDPTKKLVVPEINANVITSGDKIIANPNGDDIKRINGTLVGITTSYFNASQIDTSGIDIEASYNFDTSYGQVALGFNSAHMLEYKIPTASGMTDVVGLFNHDNFARSLPETKSVLTASLVNGNHNLTAIYRWVSEYETTRAVDAAAAARGFVQDIDAFETIDLKYTYNMELGDTNVVLSAGINNAADEKAPIVYDAANFSYDPKHHDPRGRMTYLGFKITL